jgi:hypothetical protein
MSSSSSPSSKAEDLGEPSSSAVAEARAVPRGADTAMAHIPLRAGCGWVSRVVVSGLASCADAGPIQYACSSGVGGTGSSEREREGERESEARSTQWHECMLSTSTQFRTSCRLEKLLFSISSPLALSGDHTSGLFDLGTASGRGCGGTLSSGRSPCCRSCCCRTAARGLGARARRGG